MSDTSAIGHEIARALDDIDRAGSEETIAKARRQLDDAIESATDYADRSVEQWRESCAGEAS